MDMFYSNMRATGLSTVDAKEGNDLSLLEITPIRSKIGHMLQHEGSPTTVVDNDNEQCQPETEHDAMGRYHTDTSNTSKNVGARHYKGVGKRRLDETTPFSEKNN